MTPLTLLTCSGKGGVGTSVVAALIALAAAERGDRVLLVDASEAGGTQHHLFGVRPANSLWMLTDPRVSVDDVLVAIDAQLTLVAGGTSGAAVAPASDHERRTALVRLARSYHAYDLVVFDGGSRLDTITAISELADPSLLLVTSADRLALAANYALVKSAHARKPDAAVSVVANRHGDSVAEAACDFLIGACSHFLGRTIDVAGSIPDDPCLQAAVGAGMIVHDAVDGSPAAAAARDVLSSLIPSSRTAVAGPAAMPGLSSFNRRWS